MIRVEWRAEDSRGYTYVNKIEDIYESVPSSTITSVDGRKVDQICSGCGKVIFCMDIYYNILRLNFCNDCKEEIEKGQWTVGGFHGAERIST